MTPLLAVEGLRKAYGGVAAVAGVDLSLAAGEVVALIGPNGAGKSTCFGLLAGRIRPDAGTVRLEGRDVTGRPPPELTRHGLATTFQIAAVFSSMTVRENLQTALCVRARGGLRSWGSLPRRAVAEADRRLAAVGLGDQADRPAADLAYGDVKRLELAIALVGDPILLLMDEPTAGMAPGERQALMRFAIGLARGRGAGVLFTEHDMDVVFGHADRVLVLDRGAIIAAGTPDAVRQDPRVRAVYLGPAAGDAPTTGGAPC